MFNISFLLPNVYKTIIALSFADFHRFLKKNQKKFVDNDFLITY